MGIKNIKLAEHSKRSKTELFITQKTKEICRKNFMLFLEMLRKLFYQKGNLRKKIFAFVIGKGLDKIEQMCYNCVS